MTAINFMKRFADAVESGEKCQTIRKARKNPIQTGCKLQLYTGQRTSACRKLKDARCSSVKDVEIGDYYISIDGKSLAPKFADHFARKDGFPDRHAMISFFKNQYGLPFLGVLIEWS
jgi:hypothetical protein